MMYVSLDNYKEVRQSIMEFIRVCLDNGNLTPEQVLPLIDVVYDISIVGDYEIFSNVRTQLDEGRYI